MMSKELADKLKAARKKLGLTQQEAAQQWGIPASTMIKWEQDESTPRGYALQQLNQMLDGILGQR